MSLTVQQLAYTGKGPRRFMAYDGSNPVRYVVGHGSEDAARKAWVEKYGN